MNPVVPAQSGDGNNQLENKQWFFCNQSANRYGNWRTVALAGRDGEGKKSLFLAESEIHGKGLGENDHLD